MTIRTVLQFYGLSIDLFAYGTIQVIEDNFS